MAKSHIGNCHICGAFGQLSFEHVPPEAAFNNRKVVIPTAERVFELDDLDLLNTLKGRQSQRGYGAYTLCPSCNSRTGHWYGTQYAFWAYQGARILSGTQDLSTSYPYHLLPLRVLKQIICMFLSVNSPRFRIAQPELERFVLNKEAKTYPHTSESTLHSLDQAYAVGLVLQV